MDMPEGASARRTIGGYPAFQARQELTPSGPAACMRSASGAAACARGNKMGDHLDYALRLLDRG